MATETTHSCPDCGAAPTNHTVAWLSVYLREYMAPFEKVMFPKLSAQFMERAYSAIMRTFQFLHLGKTTYAPTEKDTWRARVLWDEAIRRGIKMEEFHFLGAGQDLFFATFNGVTRCFDGLPRPYGESSDALDWMDNKAEMRKRFSVAGIPIARGGVARTEKEANELFETLEKPVIVKPKIGSRSRHTTTGLTDITTFKCACDCAWKISPWVLIEEELTGPVFRATLVGGNLVAVMRRDPAAVIGDGIHTVRELTVIENARPERHGPLFHSVPTSGEDADAFLKHQNLGWDAVPEKNRIVHLGMKTSRGVGGSTTDVTADAHPDNRELLRSVGTLLNDSLVGIDFIMSDITVSWKDQKKAGIIECNSMPFIDLHHYPLNGESINVAGALWDIIFLDSKPRHDK